MGGRFARRTATVGLVVLFALTGVPALANAGPNGDTLSAGQTLNAGQSLLSANGLYTATMQSDGNFVIYGPKGAGWNTGGGPATTITMQSDGNLVAYAADGHYTWSSSTATSRNDRLVMQGDGNLVVYSGIGVALWVNGSVIQRADTLLAGQQLTVDQYLISADGRFKASMQADGNFVVYGPSGAGWNTGGSSANRITMQSDGNLVSYASGGYTWSSGTAPSSGDRLTIQSDGNLVIYNGSNAALWSNGQRLSSSIRSAISAYVQSQVGTKDSPSNSYCNKYSGALGSGSTSGCATGNRSILWCADFARYSWQQAGVNITGLNASASSFYTYSTNHPGTWHSLGAYTPQAGDVAVYGTPSSAAHVGVVVSSGPSGPNVVNGDWGTPSVVSGIVPNQTTNGGGASLSGYVSPAGA